MSVKADWVWLNGAFLPWEDANIHLATHSLHYGCAVFEGTRAYEQTGGGTAIFRLQDHLKRLGRSGKILQLKLPYTQAELEAATLELVAKNRFQSCYLRHIAYVGAGVMGLHPRDNRIDVAIMAWPWGAYLGEDGLAKGIRCKISSYNRHFPNSSLSQAKATGNYINSILAKREVVQDGYDEAILLDTDGFVAEGSGENIFMVRDGLIKTPPLASILDGITRNTVMTLAKELGLPLVESRITRDELYIADEVFFTGTAAEITPVREIDNRPIGTGKPGPVTQGIQTAYFAAIRGETAKYKTWLSPVAGLQTV